MLRAAVAHPGAALIEVYQNCPVFNDGAFDALTDKQTRAAQGDRARARRADPLRRRARARRRARTRRRSAVVEVADVGEDALLRHDAHRADPSLAFALSRLGELEGGATPIGIFRQVARESAFTRCRGELAEARAGFGSEELGALLHQADTWRSGSDDGPGCPSRDRAVGRTFPAAHLRRRAREDPRIRARRGGDRPRCTSTSTPPAPPGTGPRRAADVRRRLLRRGDRGGAASTPRSASTSRCSLHGGQEFELGAARARRRRDHDARSSSQRSPSGSGSTFYRFRSRSVNERGEEVCSGQWTQIVRRLRT